MNGWQVPSHYERVAEDTASQRCADATAGVRVLNGFGKVRYVQDRKHSKSCSTKFISLKYLNRFAPTVYRLVPGPGN